MNTAKLLFRGAGLQVLTMVVSVASSFFLAPFVIHSLGDRWYGLWILIGSFISFYGLLDLGISAATQRYLAKALPKRDPDELNTIIAASVVMFCGIGLVAFIVTLAIVGLAPHFIDETRDVTIFREVAFIMGTGFALSFPFYTQRGILAANLRLDYAAYISIGKTLLRTALFFLVLGLGYGIVILAIMSVATDLLSYLALAITSRRLAPWMKLKARHFQLAKMRELIGFGFYSFVGQLSGTVKYQLDNIVIASNIGLAPVTHFNIATKLNSYFFTALNSAVPAPTSLYARYHGKDALRHIREKFLILSRIKTILGVLGIGAVLIFARPFITLWIGKAYLDAFAPLVIIMAGRLMNVAVNPGVGVTYALAKQKFPACLELGEALANLALSLLLVRSYGIIGVAVGTAVPMLATRLTILPVYICRIMDLPVSRFIGSIAPVMLVAIVAQLPLVYLMTQITVDTYWEIAALGIGYYAPALLFFYFTMLTREERQLFAEAAPVLTKLVTRSKRALLEH